MNKRRPLLNIEMFEDRLLPSIDAYSGFDPVAALPTNPVHISISNQQNAFANDLRTFENFISKASAYANFNGGSSTFGINGGEILFPTRLASLNSTNYFDGNMPRSDWADSPFPESLATLSNGLNFSLQPLGNYFVLGGVTSPIALSGWSVVEITWNFNAPSASDSANVNSPPPIASQDDQTSGANDPVGMNDSGPFPGRVDYVSPAQAFSMAPTEVVAPSSPTQSPPSSSASASTSGTPGLLLISTSLPQTNGQSIISEQLTQTESHILANVTLAAVSLMGPQAASSVSVLPTVLSANPSSAIEPTLHSATLDRTPLKVKAPASVAVTESTEASFATSTPIEIAAPNGAPVVGVIGLDTAELDGRVSRVLSSISDLGIELAEELGQPEAYAWLVAAGLLSVGAGYAAWNNQKSRQVAHFPLGRGSITGWEGESYDARNR
jgi:hypothetical protein